jgi:hypothetical protein
MIYSKIATNQVSIVKFILFFLFFSAQVNAQQVLVADETDAILKTPIEEVHYNQSSKPYASYTNLVMAGYQGWFAAEGDDSNRGWHHYGIKSGDSPGPTTIDMWPDMTEYENKYITPFKNEDGSNTYLYSPYDEQSVDLHFKWMKEYGIDGVHMQRFLSEVTSDKGKRHFNKVLKNALKAAKKYNRAISVMYDLSGSNSERVAYLEQDWNELVAEFNLLDIEENPTYLRHRGKPLMTIWGVGFNDGRKYSIEDVDNLVNLLKGPTNKVSIMLGVPYYWRTLKRDTEDNPALHQLIKKVDIIMPWAVGRYNISYYNPNVVAEDVKWAAENSIDYVPLVFPGFTWGNLQKNPKLYHQIPRNKGDFLWKQIAGAKAGGAKSLYVAMFDEIDEGTAIFKVKLENEVPLNGNSEYKFVGLDNSLQTDYYLWLTGQATRWFHNEGNYNHIKPIRK